MKRTPTAATAGEEQQQCAAGEGGQGRQLIRLVRLTSCSSCKATLIAVPMLVVQLVVRTLAMNASILQSRRDSRRQQQTDIASEPPLATNPRRR